MQKFRYSLSVVFLSVFLSGYSQSLIVNNGSVSVGGNTFITLQGTSLKNNDSFIASDTSTIKLTGSSGTLEIGGQSEVYLANLIADNNCDLNTTLHLSKNITMSSGFFNLNSNLLLGGDILGEREDSRITSAGSSEIIKTVSLHMNQASNPGNIGITIIPDNDYSDVEFRRGHQSVSNNSAQSINRYFSIPSFAGNVTLQFSYFDGELNGLNENSLTLMGEESSSWIPLQSLTSNTTDNVFTGTTENSMSRVTLFEGFINENLKVPSGFSPNNDGINDLFIIPGIETMPNNHLTVFNQYGDILFDATPYQNDWDGKTQSALIQTNGGQLPDGTYFYIFYPDKNNKTFKSGFIEIKTGDK